MIEKALFTVREDEQAYEDEPHNYGDEETQLIATQTTQDSDV